MLKSVALERYPTGYGITIESMECCAFKEVDGIQNWKYQPIDLLAILAWYKCTEDDWGGVILTEVTNYMDDGGEVPYEHRIGPRLTALIRENDFGTVIVPKRAVFNPNESHYVCPRIWMCAPSQAEKLEAWHNGNTWTDQEFGHTSFRF